MGYKLLLIRGIDQPSISVFREKVSNRILARLNNEIIITLNWRMSICLNLNYSVSDENEVIFYLVK